VYILANLTHAAGVYQMHALTYRGAKNIAYESVPDPRPEHAADVVVRVELCALCGSDLHPYNGREVGLDLGTVMGHEFVGTVVAVGRDVKNVQKDDRVFCPFTSNCGRCFYCRTGLTCRCVHGQLFGWVQHGAGLHGGQAEYVRVPMADATLLKLPEEITAEAGLLLGDNLATGFFCAEMADIPRNRVVAVVGCGPVGLMAVMASIELGAEVVYAVDALPARLQRARHLGAIPISFETNSAQEVIAAATRGRGADAVLEVVGSAAAACAALELVRPGGVISTVGVHTENTFAFSPAQAYDKNLTFKIGRCPARHYMERLLPVVQQKRLDLSQIITHRLRLADGAAAYEMFDQKQDDCVKVVLTP